VARDRGGLCSPDHFTASRAEWERAHSIPFQLQRLADGRHNGRQLTREIERLGYLGKGSARLARLQVHPGAEMPTVHEADLPCKATTAPTCRSALDGPRGTLTPALSPLSQRERELHVEEQGA
jgi:hypothetical protein